LNAGGLDPLTFQSFGAQVLEQRFGKHSIGIVPCLARNSPQIIAWSREPAEFVKSQPMASTVEPQRLAGRRRNLGGGGRIVGRGVGDRRHDDHDIAVLATRGRDDERAGSVLRPVFGASVFSWLQRKL
jgi:hypothetical protein